LDTALPNLHPALIHLPLAAIPLALVLDGVAAATRQSWLDRAAALLWLVGATGAAAAVLTGRDAADGLAAVPAEVEVLIGAHSDLAHQVLFALLAYAALRSIPTLRNVTVTRSPTRLGLLLVGAALQVPLVIAADRGGSLVYEHGVAVTAAAQPPPPTPEPAITSPDDPPDTRLVQDAKGGLVWAPAVGDGEALGTLLTAVEGGSLGALTALDPPDAAGLRLQVDGEGLLLLPGTFADVEVRAVLDTTDFDGTVGVAHHVHGPDDHDLLTLAADGTARLAQTLSGSVQVQAAAKVDPDSALDLRVRASGSHLKGYLGEALAVHGHVAPTAAGRVGLWLDGQGVVVVHQVRVTPL